MIKGLGLDESMSNLTSTISGERSISSNARNDNQSSSTTTATNANNNTMSFASPQQAPGQPPPAKKKRGLPGNPDPDAEVIALSPKSLLATNRFICEICNKGFQRDQNLQLHRRGHNLPWKLKQRAKDQIIRKKVYVCPEPSCVHHDPSRALGDLTGIKKHFCRKHGEKKWKCEKCSKKYAVQSDWKAHSKICGTREYRCDCGTLFSRRDSFITHRAFCDALADESARAISPLSTLPSSQTAAGVIAGITTSSSALSHINNNNNNNNNNNLPPHLSTHHHQQQQQQFLQSFPLKREPDRHHPTNLVRSDIPPWLACPPPQPHHQQQQQTMSSHLYPFQQSHYDQQSCSSDNNTGMGSTLSPFQAPVHPQMSATALLQKAAEMGVTVSNQHQHHHQQQQQVVLSNNSTTCGPANNNNVTNQGFAQEHNQAMTEAQSSMLHDVMMMSSFQPSGSQSSGGYDSSSAFGDFQQQAMAASKGSGGGGGGNDGLTRDFLGLRSFSHKDFLNMAGLGHMSQHSSASFEQQQQQQNDQQNQHQTPWLAAAASSSTTSSNEGIPCNKPS